ncbi:mechanosensitive ion channel [Pantoea sp. JZ29]|uniref:Mechanosensitive ion channel protein MscS n=2 Tax=Erwiniaceae TaxID=1903409 RepID=A0AB34VAZ8_9GAMM|nr:mechanosensitive ion channel protein MscS [Pantoea stewartii]WRH21194.1 mechanosensitive ion channel [Pantoea sp. JZ29]KHN61793.1 mechanosensitive ion channel protein MscS [Pantoea stewartii]KTS71295.1 mechanosensitive ion channel protein MscS [Pantoea stewartii]KTS94221.1 mechanosensitive ion channel protein MscS [Pantoea stewartii]
MMPLLIGELSGAPTWIPAVLLVTLSFIVGFLARFIFLRFIRFWQNRDRKLFKSLEKHLRGSLFLFIPLVLINIGINYIDLRPETVAFITSTANIFIILSICSILIRLTNVAQDMLFIRYDINLSNNLRARKIRTQLIYVKKVAIVILVSLSLSMILLSFPGVRKFGTTILAGAGVAGIIIGFALQKSLVNLFAGIQIAFTQPIKIDDAVVVEKEWGWIEEINLTYVVVRIWDLRRLVLPITYFTENAFQNWTRNNAQILGSVFLYVDYSLPLEPLRQHFEKVLSETKLWDQQTQVLQVTDTSEKTMTIRLLMTAQNSPTAWDLRCYVREKMIEFIQQNYPQSLPHVRATLTGTDSR